MSDDSSNNGASPPTAPELDEAAQAAISMVGSLVQGFAKDLPDEAVVQIAAGELSQQGGLGAVLTDAVEASARQAHPAFGFRIRNLRDNEIVATVAAPKDLAKSKDLNQLKHGVDVIAYATSPAARAIMRSFGFAIEFFQGPLEDGPRVIRPS